MSPMYLDYFIKTTSPIYLFIFDDDLGHGNHSGELLLFVGCIVNFIVSYLICMFQDSVPAGSYNDPFLSSVCVCEKADYERQGKELQAKQGKEVRTTGKQRMQGERTIKNRKR